MFIFSFFGLKFWWRFFGGGVPPRIAQIKKHLHFEHGFLLGIFVSFVSLPVFVSCPKAEQSKIYTCQVLLIQSSKVSIN